MRLRSVLDWWVYFLIRVVICILQTLRIETCQVATRGLAILACDIIKLRYNVVDDNLRHVYPDWSPERRRRLIRSMWEHLFLMVAEIAHAPRKLHEANYQQYVVFRNKPLVVRYLLDSRPTVIVTGHYGNFEIAGYVLGLFGFPSFTIARRLDNPYLDRFVNRFRGLKGQFILPKIGSASQVERVLRSGGTLSLLGDQHAGDKGCWVDFLGRPASCHKAVALFTLTSGAPELVAYVRRLDRPMRFEIGVVDVVDPDTMDPALAGVRQLTQWYNQRLEEMIRAAPEQYWWVHRRWKGQPPARHRKQKAAELNAEHRAA